MFSGGGGVCLFFFSFWDKRTKSDSSHSFGLFLNIFHFTSVHCHLSIVTARGGVVAKPNGKMVEPINQGFNPSSATCSGTLIHLFRGSVSSSVSLG